jgi:hypothetical protein
MERFESNGVDAFDHLYVSDETNAILFDQSNQYPLFGTQRQEEPDDNKHTGGPSKPYSGFTHFFFLTSALLRVAVHSAMKMEHEYYEQNHKLIEAIQEGATSDRETPLPPRFLAQASPVVATWLGWKVFMEEPEFVTNATNFALLQLRWVLALAAKAGSRPFLPDWMVKDPARWLAEVARRTPNLLKQAHAEQAVECCTELLEIGNESFSPIVVTCLVRIASAFVYAGVHRARQRQRQRHRRGRRWAGEQEFDDRSLDIYLSFEKNDLGVTVFTNQLVCTRLCPTLIRTFKTLDIVEGLDMDREYDFNKFSVKIEVADLLLRLWSHPNGEARMSVVKSVGHSDLLSFASSLSTALSVFLDSAVQQVTTTLKTMQTGDSILDQPFIDAHSSAAAGGLSGARRLLLLLCTLSQEGRIACAFGGGDVDDDNDRHNKKVVDLANAIVHFVDILTGEDGGTHPELERGLSESTFFMLQRSSTMSQDESKKLVQQLIKSRQFCKLEIGLDVSVVCHQLLALAARWHAMAVKNDSPSKGSLLLSALVLHDDLDVDRFQRILDRLILPTPLEANKDDSSVFFNDGYHAAQDSTQKESELNQETKRRRNRARQDQMSHEAIDELLGSRALIKTFLKDLRDGIDKRKSTMATEAVDPSSLVGTQRALLLHGGMLQEEEYEENMSAWVVSSSPFANPSDNTKFIHYYDGTARSRISTGSGKCLVKEARRCQKNLPMPHANSSCFVCFAEERMDLCRAVVTGPVRQM